MLVVLRDGLSSFIPARHRCSDRVFCAWNEFLLKKWGVLCPPEAWLCSVGLGLLTALTAKEQHRVLVSFSSWEIAPSLCEQGRKSHPRPEQHPLGKVGDPAGVAWVGSSGRGAMFLAARGCQQRRGRMAQPGRD